MHPVTSYVTSYNAPRYLLHGSYASWWHARVSWAMHPAAPMLPTLGPSVECMTAENDRCEKYLERIMRQQQASVACRDEVDEGDEGVHKRALLIWVFCALLCGVLHSD
jgi:hypothetical protein